MQDSTSVLHSACTAPKCGSQSTPAACDNVADHGALRSGSTGDRKTTESARSEIGPLSTREHLALRIAESVQKRHSQGERIPEKLSPVIRGIVTDLRLQVLDEQMINRDPVKLLPNTDRRPLNESDSRVLEEEIVTHPVVDSFDSVDSVWSGFAGRADSVRGFDEQGFAVSTEPVPLPSGPAEASVNEDEHESFTFANDSTFSPIRRDLEELLPHEIPLSKYLSLADLKRVAFGEIFKYSPRDPVAMQAAILATKVESRILRNSPGPSPTSPFAPEEIFLRPRSRQSALFYTESAGSPRPRRKPSVDAFVPSPATSNSGRTTPVIRSPYSLSHTHPRSPSACIAKPHSFSQRMPDLVSSVLENAIDRARTSSQVKASKSRELSRAINDVALAMRSAKLKK